MDDAVAPDTKRSRGRPEPLAPNSRFWKIYREEASKYDDDMINAWNGSLDILLIFAGLFSAVSTAFIIESYKDLQPDYTEYSARLLFLSLSTPNRTSLAEPGVVPSPETFIASSLTKWINGLWFLSLVLSLGTALVCILAKTWLIEYRMFSFGSASEWAHHTVYRYNGLTKWHVREIISTLPVALHLSLFLFFAGLVLFLADLDSTLAIICGVISLFVFLLYVIFLVIPAWHPDCPYRTPLMNQIERTLKYIWQLLHVATIRLDRQPDSSWTSWISHAIRLRDDWCATTRTPGWLSAQAGAARERAAIAANTPPLTAEAIYWIIRSSPHLPSVSAAVQAIGSLHLHSPEIDVLRDFAVMPRIVAHVQARFPGLSPDNTAVDRLQLSPDEHSEYLHYLRAVQVLLGRRKLTPEETTFVLTMTDFDMEPGSRTDDYDGDTDLLVICGHWLHYTQAYSVTSEKKILAFFSEENTLARAPTTRFTWEVLMHALRCFAHSHSDLKKYSIPFFTQSLVKFAPRWKDQDKLAISSELRLLLVDRYDETIPSEYSHKHTSGDPDHHMLETWCILLPTLTPIEPSTSFRQILDLFIDSVLCVTQERAAITPKLVSYLTSESFFDIPWSRSDLSSLHQALRYISRHHSFHDDLIPPLLNLHCFLAERLSSDGRPMFAFPDVLSPSLSTITPSSAHVITRHFLSSPNSRPWSAIRAANQPSLHFAYLGDLLAQSLCNYPTLVTDHESVDEFFKSHLVEHMIQAIYALDPEHAADPEIMHGFLQTWVSALQHLVQHRTHWPEWQRVREAFIQHPPAHGIANNSLYTPTASKTKTWLREWLS